MAAKKSSVNKLTKQKQRVIKELKKSGKAYRKARKEFGKNDPLRKRSSAKKTKKAKKLSKWYLFSKIMNANLFETCDPLIVKSYFIVCFFMPFIP